MSISSVVERSRGAFNHALTSCLHEFTLRGTSGTDVTLGADDYAYSTPGRRTPARGCLPRRPRAAPRCAVWTPDPRRVHGRPRRAAGGLARVGAGRGDRGVFRAGHARAVGAPGG